MIWKYIIRDLNGAIQYLPYGVMAGAVMGLILNAMNARRERKGKEAFPMAGLMVFSLYLMIILVITFFSREDGSRNRAMDLSFSPPGGSIREITPSWWKTCCFSSRMALHAPGHFPGLGDFSGTSLRLLRPAWEWRLSSSLPAEVIFRSMIS